MLDASEDNNKESNILNYLSDTSNINVNNQGDITTEIKKKSSIRGLYANKNNSKLSITGQQLALKNLHNKVKKLLIHHLRSKTIDELQQQYSPMQLTAEKTRLNNVISHLLTQLQKNPIIEDLNKLIYTYREKADLVLGIIHFHNCGTLPVIGTDHTLQVTIRDARLQSYISQDSVTKKPGDIPEHWFEVICHRVRGATLFIEIHTNKHLVDIAKQNLMKILANYNNKLLDKNEFELSTIVNQFNEDLFDLLIKYNHSNVTPLSKDDLKLVCDYSQFDEEHRHIINITKNTSNINNPSYPIIASLIVAPMSNSTIELEYGAISQLGKSKNFDILRAKHFRIISNSEEYSLDQVTQKCPKWFANSQQLEQELIIKYHDQIVSNKKLIPAALYNLPGLKNTCLDIYGLATADREQCIILSHSKFTSGFLVPIEYKNADEEIKLTQANLLQLKSLGGTDNLDITVLLPKTNILFMLRDNNHVKKLQNITSRMNDITLHTNAKNASDTVSQDITENTTFIYVCADGASRSGIAMKKDFINWAVQDKNIDLNNITNSIFTSRQQEHKIGGPGSTTGLYGMNFYEALGENAVYTPSPISYVGRVHFNPLLTKLGNSIKFVTSSLSKMSLNIGKSFFQIIMKSNNKEIKQIDDITEQDIQRRDVIHQHVNSITTKQIANEFLCSEIHTKLSNHSVRNYASVDKNHSCKTSNLPKRKTNRSKFIHR